MHAAGTIESVPYCLAQAWQPCSVLAVLTCKQLGLLHAINSLLTVHVEDGLWHQRQQPSSADAMGCGYVRGVRSLVMIACL